MKPLVYFVCLTNRPALLILYPYTAERRDVFSNELQLEAILSGLAGMFWCFPWQQMAVPSVSISSGIFEKQRVQGYQIWHSYRSTSQLFVDITGRTFCYAWTHWIRFWSTIAQPTCWHFACPLMSTLCLDLNLSWSIVNVFARGCVPDIPPGKCIKKHCPSGNISQYTP